MGTTDIYQQLADAENQPDQKNEGTNASFSMPEGISERRGRAGNESNRVIGKTDSKNPLGSKSNGNRFSSMASGISNPISSFEKKDIAMMLLWVALLAIVFHGYNSDVYGKMQTLPTKHKSLVVAKQNIAAQKKEIEYLDQLSIEPKDLEMKEEALAKYLNKDSPKVAFIQTNVINQIADVSGVQMGNYIKSSEQREESRVGDLGKPLEANGIGNFYENAWFNKYSMEITASEDQTMRFMEELERIPSFIMDSFEISRTGEDIKYSLIAKSFYLLNDSTDGNN